MHAGTGQAIILATWPTRPPRIPVAVALVLFALLIGLINPVGYIGGGSDDWQYLEAARCAARYGLCLPDTHWSARFPIVLPTAAVIALLGEARHTVWLVPLAYGLAGIALFGSIMERRFGRLAALIGGIALVATPMIGGQLFALNISSVELCFVLASGFCLQRALESGDKRWSAAAGLALALAILTRMTSLALVPIAILAFAALPRRYWFHAAPMAIGLAGVLAAEASAYFLAIGDPFYSWKLALGHTRVPTSELAANVDLTESPLFNPAFIGGWRHSMGIDVHWTIDAALNLLADPSLGLTLLAAIGLLLIHRRALGPEQPYGRVPLYLLGAGALYFGALTYGLAIDPQPRMFLPTAAAASAIIGILGARSWRDGARPGVLILLAALTLNLALTVYRAFDLERIERVASAWAMEAPFELAVDETARRVLTLSEPVRRLKVYPAQASDRLMIIAGGRCPARLTDAQSGDHWTAVRAQSFSPIDPAPIAALRERQILFASGEMMSLCAFARSDAL